MNSLEYLLNKKRIEEAEDIKFYITIATLIIYFIFVVPVKTYCGYYSINMLLEILEKTHRVGVLPCLLLGFVPYLNRLLIPMAVLMFLSTYFL